MLSVTHNIVIVLLQRYSKGSDFSIMEFMEIILFVGQDDRFSRKSFEKQRNLPGERTCMKLSKVVGCLDVFHGKRGKATTLYDIVTLSLENYSASLSKFRFILPNLHKMNWRDLVTFCIVNLRKISYLVQKIVL